MSVESGKELAPPEFTFVRKRRSVPPAQRVPSPMPRSLIEDPSAEPPR